MKTKQLDIFFVADSSTLVAKLLMPSLSRGQEITIGCFLHRTWFRVSRHMVAGHGDGTLLVPEWHSAPWWPLGITKHGSWLGFVTASLRIQPYEAIFIPGATASCVFTTGVPSFCLLALKLCFCGAHILARRTSSVLPCVKS